MSPRIAVEVGHNIRAWTTFTVENPTEEEVSALTHTDVDQAMDALERLIDSKRAVEGDTQYEELPPVFDREVAEPDIVNIDMEGVGQ